MKNLDNLNDADLMAYMEEKETAANTETPVFSVETASNEELDDSGKQNAKEQPPTAVKKRLQQSQSVSADNLMEEILKRTKQMRSSSEPADAFQIPEDAFADITVEIDAEPGEVSLDDAFPDDTEFNRVSYDYDGETVEDDDEYEIDDEEAAEYDSSDADYYPNEEYDEEEEEPSETYTDYNPDEVFDSHYSLPKNYEETIREKIYRLKQENAFIREDIPPYTEPEEEQENIPPMWKQGIHHYRSRRDERVYEYQSSTSDDGEEYSVTPEEATALDQQEQKESAQQKYINMMRMGVAAYQKQYEEEQNAFQNITAISMEQTLNKPQQDYEAMSNAAEKAIFINQTPSQPAETTTDQLYADMEGVLVTMHEELTHESYQKHIRKYANKAQFKEPNFTRDEKDGIGWFPIIFFGILILGFSVYAGIITNAYYWDALGHGTTLPTLQAFFKALTESGNYKVNLLPLDTRYFFTGFGVVFGLAALIGVFIWLDTSQNKSSRVGHEHGEKHIATMAELKKYKRDYMETDAVYRDPVVSSPDNTEE